ncbi:MAG: fibronectin type III domain-containing protein, partial [Gammaproteobacteria bacterium]|nr:fibronectin type III domain-containing protein [Gammaproteobacteria bacterium]
MRPVRLAAHFALAAAAAWALAQGTTPAERAAAPANRAPELALPAGGVLVRAGESASVVVEALDPDILADGAPEAVWLGVELRSGSHAPPPWLVRTAWSAGPSERPRLELGIAPPFDAAPGSFTVEAGATDSRGLSTLARFGVTVLPPRCGPLEIDEDGTCVRCPENRLPDGSRSFCELCPSGTERPVGAPSCAACAAGLSSEAGGACGCGPAGVLDEGRCVECPPHTEGAAEGNWCAACPSGTERPAGSPECATAVLATASKSALAPVQDAARAREVAVVASLGGGGRELWEDAGEVQVRLKLKPKPSAGNYAGCRLRLSAGSEAGASDVTFSNRRKLTPDNGWSGQTGLMTVVDDALDEGDETLVVEGYCASSGNGADPKHKALVSRPLTLTIRDNDAALSLSVAPDAIGESLGRQAVEVAAVLSRPAPRPVEVPLTLGAGAYSVAGTRRISIAAGGVRGATALAITPADDSNATDDAVAIEGTAAGHRVTGTTLTIREPVIAGGVDISGLGVALSVSPTALREGKRGAHRVSATLTGVPVPEADVAMVLAVGGTATEGASHDFTLKGGRDWRKLAVAANDPFLTAGTKVTVSARADGIDEGDETVTFSVAQVAWGTTVVPLRPPATATLTITEAWEAPAAPTGLAASPSPGDERHGLDVAWEAVAANPPVDGYVVRHRKVSDPPAKWTASKPQPGLRAAVTGLSAGTRYEVRVRADNAAGQGAESGSAFARTADGNCTVGAPQVANPSGARAATELEVAWEAAACAPAASISNYVVRYREDPVVEGVANAWLRETSNGLTATLAGLAPDTAYVVEVRAVATGGDNGPWSPAGRGRTGLDARLPPRVAAPDVAASADRGDAQLDVAWHRVTWTDANGVAQPVSDYQYRYRPDGGDWTMPTDARATDAETATMTRTLAGLASGTWHEVQVRGVNRPQGAAHPGKWSEPGRGRTWGVPDRVQEPAAYGAGGSAAVVWEAPDDGGSPISDYDVRFRTDGARSWTTHPYAGCGSAGCEMETT